MTASKSQGNRARFVASAAMCAALYTVFDALTSLIRTPWGIGEFRPGIVIPAFFAIVVGPLPAALGAAVGSFVADMLTLVPQGSSTPILAAVAGAPGNFIGILLLGWVYQKSKSWKGFIGGTTLGLIVGNLWAAAFVVWLAHLPSSYTLGLLLFWFGTMFPFVVILVPAMIRYLRPYASKLSAGSKYPVITEPNRKVLWAWSISVALVVLAAMGVLLAFETHLINQNPSVVEVLFGISAAAVLVVGALIPRTETKNERPAIEEQKPTAV